MESEMAQRLIALVTSALLIGGAFVGAPAQVRAAADSMNVYIGFNTSASGGSCADPDFTADGVEDHDVLYAALDATASGGTLHVCAGVYDIEEKIFYSNDINLQGAGALITVLDGGDASNPDPTVHTDGHQIIMSTANVTVSGLTFRNAYTSSATGNSAGAAIYASGTVTVTSCIFLNNSASQGGGAILAQGAVTIVGSTFTNNSGPFAGAIWAEGTTITVTSSTFTGNTSTRGGALAAGGNISVSTSTFTDNIASEIEGGAIYGVTTVTVSSSTFTNNQAGTIGGAIFANGDIEITSGTFTGNTAVSAGGAVHTNASADIQDSTFTNNSALQGGAIYTYGTLNARSSTYIGNTATNGGAISYSVSGGTLCSETQAAPGSWESCALPASNREVSPWLLPLLMLAALTTAAGVSLLRGDTRA